MNQYFLEVRGKEKIDEWVDEGRRSRIVHLPGASRASLIQRLSVFIVMLVGLAGILVLLGH